LTAMRHAVFDVVRSPLGASPAGEEGAAPNHGKDEQGVYSEDGAYR
jgi:hypothetical protein